MRLASVLLAITILSTAALPAMAAEANSSSPTFGKAYCKPTFSCPSLSSTENQKAVAQTALAIATSCATGRLRITAPKGVFESGLGLDSSLCFTTKKLPKSESGLTMVPKCCVQPVPNSQNTCQVVCTVYGTK